MQTPVVSQVPRGVGAPPPPGMDPRKGKGKLMCIKVRMLDDSVSVFHLGHKATGQALFDEVCRHLNLLECDYFGLEFIDGYGNRCWLDKDKSILRQITSTRSDARFYFILKFYTPNPIDLEEEYTRYLVCLQIRRDLARGEFICNENTAALLASFIVQAECGDFSLEDYPDHTYLSVTNFVPNQTANFQMKVMENHKKLIGMTPADSDLALLETARRCDFYGIKLYLAKDIEGTDVSLAVAHMGIRVFHQLNCVSTFSWAKIRKLSFKRKRLMIKLHPESYQYYKEIIEFNFENRNDCKNFWKKCVEHHAFFRCLGQNEPKRESKLFSRGSSFHYQGRTQKQLIDYVREHHKRREPFQRPIKAQRSSASGSTTRHIQFNMNGERYATVIRNPESIARSDTTEPRHSSSLQNPHATSNLGANVYYGTISSEPTTSRARPHQAMDTGKSGSSEARQYNSDVESSSAGAVISGGRNPRNSSAKRDRNVAETKSRQEKLHKEENRSSPQAPDQMSISMPNVLAEDLKVLCKEFELRGCAQAPKSASGEDFLEASTSRNFQSCRERQSYGVITDNMSEGSYRLADPDYSSSQSDVGSSSCGISAVNPRVYSTNFTTKRVGNVIVKRVIDSNTPTTSTYGSNNIPQTNSHKTQGDSFHVHKSKQHYTQNNNNGEKSDSDDCLSSYSDFYCKSSVSAPAAPNTRRNLSDTGTSSITMTNRLRSAMPIPIDGPSIERNIFQINNGNDPNRSHINPSKIIRPVVIPSPNNSNLFAIKESNQCISSASKPISVVPLSTRNGPNTSEFKPIVHGLKSSFETHLSHPVALSTGEVGSSSQAGAHAPLPGRVIQKSNLVITPDGIGLKEDIIKRQKPQVPPKVPPKPSKEVLISHLKTSNPPATSNLNLQNDSPKIANNDEVSTLLAPLNSILNNAQDLSQMLSCGAKTPTEPTKQPAPSMISVESVDHPDVKTVHVFGAQIPYTLTMRNRGESNVKEDNSEKNQDPNSGAILRLKTGDGRSHRKSLELVHRKRLPSQDSFSSQDHSISPTSPDSGNVMEYMLRRRSLSNDRYTSASKKPLNESKSITSCTTKPSTKSERRKTMPVYSSNLSEKNLFEEKSNGEKTVDASLKPDEGDSSSGELPDAPAPPKTLDSKCKEPFEENTLITKQNETPEAILTTQILQGILETDF